MRFAVAASAAALVAGVVALSNDTVVYVTDTVSEYTTVCPATVASTQWSHNGVTYTATASQTVTVTDCPCTVTYPSSNSSSTAAPVSAAPVPYTPSSGIYSNGTAPTTSAAVSGAVPGSSTASPSSYTGAASKISGAGAGLVAVLAAAVYAL